jgi:hypothetical protein
LNLAQSACFGGFFAIGCVTISAFFFTKIYAWSIIERSGVLEFNYNLLTVGAIGVPESNPLSTIFSQQMDLADVQNTYTTLCARARHARERDGEELQPNEKNSAPNHLARALSLSLQPSSFCETIHVFPSP